MKNKNPHKVSPTFIVMLLLFVILLLYFCFNLASETGLISSFKKPATLQIDTNQIKLNQKDSIISLKDQEIAKLKEELAEAPDTVFVPKYIFKKDTSIKVNLPVIKSDSSN